MIMVLNNRITVIEPTEGTVIVTRPTIFGKVAVHTIISPYRAEQIAAWLENGQAMAQNEFPLMSAGDREFLITGLTPAEWDRLMGEAS